MLYSSVRWWGGNGLEVSVYVHAVFCVVSPRSLDFVVYVADVNDFVVLFRWCGCCFAAFDRDGGVFEDWVVCDAFASVWWVRACWDELYVFVLCRCESCWCR